MTRTARSMVLTVALLFTTFVSVTANAAPTNGQQRLVDRARLALDSFLDDPNFEEMGVYVQNAYGVLIVPDMLRAGFFFGGEHGVGVLMVRDTQTGMWGKPAFYELYGGSFGLQFGGQSADVVVTIMNKAALERLVDSSVRMKFGAGAGLAVGRVGASVGAGTTFHFGEDFYSFAKGRGLFGGMALDSTVLVPKDDWNKSFYGKKVGPIDLLDPQQPVEIAEVDALHQSLTRF